MLARMRGMEAAVAAARQGKAVASAAQAHAELADLKLEHEALKRKCRALADRARHAEEELKRKEELKGRPWYETRAGAEGWRGPRASGSRRMPPAPGQHTTPHMPDKLAAAQAALSEARASLAELERENARLREELYALDGAEAGPRTLDEASMASMRDKDAQIALLKQRIAVMQQDISAEREVYRRTVDALEERTRQLTDAQLAARNAAADAETARSAADALREAQGEVDALRAELARLEGEKLQLLAAPWSSTTADAASTARDAVQARAACRTAEARAAQAEAAAQAAAAELAALRRQTQDSEAQVSSLQEENSRLRTAARAAAHGTAALQERLSVYAGVLGGPAGGGTALDGTSLLALSAVPPEDLEAALGDVRRRLDAAVAGQDPAAGSSMSGSQLARMQTRLLEAQHDAERAERMLAAQSALARELTAEVEELRADRSVAVAKSSADAAAARSAAAEANAKAVALEAQVAELQAALEQAGQAAETDPNAAPFEELPGLRVLTRALNVDWDAAVGPMRPGESAMEVLITSATLSASGCTAAGVTQVHDFTGLTTFALLEFLNFETQVSPLATGLAPMYNFAVGYKFSPAPALLQAMLGGPGSAQLEIAAVVGGDWHSLGRISLPLWPLLVQQTGADGVVLAPRGLRVEDVPILSATGVKAGVISCQIALALPLLRAWTAHVAAHPRAAAQLQAARRATAALLQGQLEQSAMAHHASTPESPSKPGAGDGGSDEDGAETGGGGAAPAAQPSPGPSPSALPLHVNILEARQLVGPQGPVQRPVVKYTLPPGLGAASDWPTVLTLTPAGSAAAMATSGTAHAAASAVHVIPARPDSVEALRANSLTLAVYDGADLVGHAALSIASLADGVPAAGWFDVCSQRSGAAVGQLRVRVVWQAGVTRMVAALAAGRALSAEAAAVLPANAIAYSSLRALAGYYMSHAPIGVRVAEFLRAVAWLQPTARVAVLNARAAIADTVGPETRLQDAAWALALTKAAEIVGAAQGALTAEQAATALLEQGGVSVYVPGAEGTDLGACVVSGGLARVLTTIAGAAAEWSHLVAGSSDLAALPTGQACTIPDALAIDELASAALPATEWIALLAPRSSAARAAEDVLCSVMATRLAASAEPQAAARATLQALLSVACGIGVASKAQLAAALGQLGIAVLDAPTREEDGAADAMLGEASPPNHDAPLAVDAAAPEPKPATAVAEQPSSASAASRVAASAVASAGSAAASPPSDAQNDVGSSAVPSVTVSPCTARVLAAIQQGASDGAGPAATVGALWFNQLCAAGSKPKCITPDSLSEHASVLAGPLSADEAAAVLSELRAMSAGPAHFTASAQAADTLVLWQWLVLVQWLAQPGGAKLAWTAADRTLDPAAVAQLSGPCLAVHPMQQLQVAITAAVSGDASTERGAVHKFRSVCNKLLTQAESGKLPVRQVHLALKTVRLALPRAIEGALVARASTPELTELLAAVGPRSRELSRVTRAIEKHQQSVAYGTAIALDVPVEPEPLIRLVEQAVEKASGRRASPSAADSHA